MDSSAEELRRRRMHSAKLRELASKREAYGEKLAAAFWPVAGRKLALADFSLEVQAPFNVVLPEKLDASPGLVVAYIHSERAADVATCIDEKELSRSGLVGVLNNEYLGLCRVAEFTVLKALNVARDINDTVVFYPDDLVGAIVVDCYSGGPWGEFSLILQGDQVIESMDKCFQ